ncbi:MAG: class I SAM-dependent methyltransferase [Candidatus Omnitrophica bacterium]|nr:class I SAM-dependent methyltransferase [Candidatus Omnitrophota bacterium]MBU4468390.1 class I SAM-dependent methyltransferase [Candidatus Omnitrophota bacterium]MCG2707685.1 class I SAM-dependent methyltransferase [Candidatus Omnitrophota bacterium]
MYKKTIIVFTLAFLWFSNSISNTYAENNSKFRFAVMGCMHLGICDLQDYELAVEKIKQYKPDFVLFLGGMIDVLGKEPVDTLWQKFDRTTKKLGIPAYDAISECQILFLSKPKDRTALMEKNFLDRYKNRYYAFKHKNNLFVSLDTNNLPYQKRNTAISENQLDFLNKILSDVSRYNNVFIFTQRSPWFLGEAKEWFKSIHPLIESKAKYVFGANTHYFDMRKVGRVTYVTSGTPPCCLKSDTVKSSFFHFLIVDVEKNNISVKIVPIKPIPIEDLESSYKEQEFSPSKENSEPPEQHNSIKPLLLTAAEREFFLNPNRVTETLKIKASMNILDIGGGTGLFTFRFAEALKGTGAVFVTDIDPEMINYIKKKTKETKYKNVFPTCVKSQGVDPFYKEHSFDIVFMSEAYQYLRHPQDYFQELRLSLKKDTGRLYIIHSKNVYDFSEIEFEDFRNTINALTSKGEDFPVFKRMRKEIQDFIKDWKGNDIPAEIPKMITEDFNKMLLDRMLLYDLMDYYAAKGMVAGEGEWSAPLMFTTFLYDIKLAKWLFVHLDADGVFDNRKKLTDIDKERLRKLNRILLTREFGINRLMHLQGELGAPIYAEKSSVIAKLKAAGYQFIREYDFLKDHYFLEFKRKK